MSPENLEQYDYMKKFLRILVWMENEKWKAQID